MDTDSHLAVVVLAAGKGTRMNSDLPKVLHRIAGRSLLEHVLATAANVGALRCVVVVGHGREQVISAVSGPNIAFATQDPPLGTGHAVMQALPVLAGFQGDIIVLSGDVPLLRADTIRAMIQSHRVSKCAATVLSTTAPDPTGYGRIVRDQDGQFLRIVEHKDASPAELGLDEINSGIYCFDSVKLGEVLPLIQPNNAKREYYLTDAIGLIRSQGGLVQAVKLAEYTEICGINTQAELRAAEEFWLARQA